MTHTVWFNYLANMRILPSGGLSAISAGVLLFFLLFSCSTTPASITDNGEALAAPMITRDEPISLEDILYVSGLGTFAATVSPDGSSGKRILESDGFPGFARGTMTAHAWSSAGDAVAVAVHLRTNEGERLEAVYVAREGSREVEPVFVSPEVSPFYIYWRPNSQELSLIGGDGTGALYLYVVDTETGETELAHRGNSSLYWSWSSDGESLVTHTGGGLRDGQGTLRIHRRQESLFLPQVLTRQERTAGRFQVPDVAAGGGRIAVVLRNQFGTNTLAVISPEGNVLRRVADFAGVATFSWSPDGKYLAYVDGNIRYGGGIVGTLNIVDTDEVDRVVRPDAEHALPAVWHPDERSILPVQLDDQGQPDLVLSYFWSPDSSRLLYFEPRYIQQGDGPLEILMQASLWDPATGERDVLGSYRPAHEFLRRILPFYDQYARSSTVWDPSGERIVFNGLNEEGRQAIFVIDLDQREAGPREIAEGVVPLWRPTP